MVDNSSQAFEKLPRHRVPLSAPAVALIRDRLENHTSPYVFPGESGPRSHGATIRRPMAQLRTTTASSSGPMTSEEQSPRSSRAWALHAS